MRTYRIVVATVVAGTLLALASATSAVPLTLTGPIQGNTLGPQSASNPCIIAGTQCQQPAGFSFNNFTSSGAISSYNMFSTTPTANVADGVQGTPYTVQQIDDVTNNLPFSVAIDVNTNNAAGETLQLFEVIVNGVVVYNFVGPAPIGGIASNGNGFGDWSLGTIDLSSFSQNSTVLFHAVWGGASAGAESFFIVGSQAAVPEPATLLLFGSAMTELGIWGGSGARVARSRSADRLDLRSATKAAGAPLRLFALSCGPCLFLALVGCRPTDAGGCRRTTRGATRSRRWNPSSRRRSRPRYPSYTPG